jgi:two-component system cell cycle sensor histidine kinase/response regulator CckA
MGDDRGEMNPREEDIGRKEIPFDEPGNKTEGLKPGPDFMSVMMDTIETLVLVLDRNGIIVTFNMACERATGYKSVEVLGKAIWDLFIPSEQLEDVRHVFDDLKAGMFPNQYENHWLRKNGSRFLVSWSNNALLDADGNVAYVVASGIDITDQREAEEELRGSESRTRALLDAIPDMMFRMNSEGVFLDFKGHSNSPTVMPPEAFLGKNIADVLPGDVASQTMYHIRLALRERVAQKFEYSLETPQGMGHFEARIVVSGADEVTAIVRDITGHRSLEEQLLHSQKMEAIGTLTGGVAHEFNNILTAIMGFTELLRHTVKSDSDSAEYVKMIESSALRAAKLTEGLLTYSRKHVTHLEATNVNEIICEVEGFLSRLMGPGITLNISAAGPPLMVNADKSHIEQVLVNLSTNAFAAMPHGGTVGITAQFRTLEADIRAHQATVPRGSYALISVSDTGEGMPREIQEKIFEPFFTTKDVGKGTGLGLSMVVGIVRKHKGYIQVESAPGEGTTFRIYLPLISEVDAAWAEETAAAPVGGVETILLAEDDGAVRKLMAQVLQNAGYDVIEASNGDAAIVMFLENREAVDLLLLDYAMPVRNGRAVYDYIRGTAPNVKVIFMSGYVTDAKVRDELESTFPFLAKPVRQNHLLAKVREVLGEAEGPRGDTSAG